MAEAMVRVRSDTYVDSVLLMAATRAMEGISGVEWAAVLMGTPVNVETLRSEGFDGSVLQSAGANDVVFAVRAHSTDQCEEALSAADGALEREETSPVPGKQERPPRSLQEARATLPSANVAVISVPGAYAGMEAYKALHAGLHVLLFSDNVPISHEIQLKRRAQELNLLVMGPGAGTAMLGGVGLGFANVVRRGRVGVAAAAGTGAQEVMSLLDGWGAGLSHVIGVGGRDLSRDVGGRMMRLAVGALEDDPATDLILIVSKPPAPSIAHALLHGLRGDKPVVAAMIGLRERFPVPDNVTLAGTMEEAVLLSLHALGMPEPPVPGSGEVLSKAAASLPPERHAVRGLFSGGTLCYETIHVLASSLGPVYSNTPLDPRWALPAPPGSHVCLDLGEEEYTRGRPHPMIDPEARADLIRKEGKDTATAVVLIDVVLGYGSHPDPASVLAPACAEVLSQPRVPAVIAYVLGTKGDPQNYEFQCRQLEEAGCVLAPTTAGAARMAASLASRTGVASGGSP